MEYNTISGFIEDCFSQIHRKNRPPIHYRIGGGIRYLSLTVSVFSI